MKDEEEKLRETIKFPEIRSAPPMAGVGKTRARLKKYWEVFKALLRGPFPEIRNGPTMVDVSEIVRSKRKTELEPGEVEND